jgi:hypothetical protein
MPGVARGLQISVTGDRVMLGLDLDPDQLIASLRQTELAPVPVAPAPVAARVPAPVPPPKQVAAPVPAPPVVAEAPKPPERQVIRIFGLDDGPREIVLPPEPRF